MKKMSLLAIFCIVSVFAYSLDFKVTSFQKNAFDHVNDMGETSFLFPTEL